MNIITTHYIKNWAFDFVKTQSKRIRSIFMSDKQRPIYVLCPRCELNYIENTEQYCNVCKAELGLVDKSILIPDDEEMETEKLCPICKANYLNEDEEICFLCQKTHNAVEKAEEDNWDYTDDDNKDTEDEMVVSLEMVAEEEEEEEEEDDGKAYKEPDDFDYNVDPNDYLDDDEDDEDEDEDDDDDFILP